MGWKDREVSSNTATGFFAVCAIAGLALGLIAENGWSLALLALLLFGWIGYCNVYQTREVTDIEVVFLIGLFVWLVTALLVTGNRLIWTTPGVPLMAFWLYALIATGYLISRCCLGWHIGASVAVLTAFIAVGLFVQSFYGAGPEWAAALIVAAGLWWGADSWRRANGLAVYE